MKIIILASLAWIMSFSTVKQDLQRFYIKLAVLISSDDVILSSVRKLNSFQANLGVFDGTDWYLGWDC